MKPLRTLPVFFTSLAVLLYAAFIFSCSFVWEGNLYFLLFDDAMIGMQYARNLAEGHGLVWNAGEVPVEGYTNFLWTACLALFHLLPTSDQLVSLWVMLSCAGILLANGALVYRIALELGASRPAAWTATGFSLLGYGLMYWTLRGMEVGACALIIHAAMLWALRFSKTPQPGLPWKISLLLCCGLLVRTDMALPYACIALYITAAQPHQRWKNFLLLAAGGAGTLALHFIVRKVWYGEYVPNTYFLKLGFIPLSDRLGRGWSCLLDTLNLRLLLFAVPAILLFVLRPALLRSLHVLLPAALFVTSCSYSVYVGGDAWEWMPFPNRYISTTSGELFLLAAMGYAAIASRLNLTMNARMQGISVVCLVLLCSYVSTYRAWNNWWTRKPQGLKEEVLTARLGLLVNQCTAPQVSMAVVSAGNLPYFAHRKSVDLLGKNDAFIAHLPPKWRFFPGHNKWDYDYSLRTYQPDLVMQLWIHDTSDVRNIHHLGYLRLSNGVFIREQSLALVDTTRLSHFVLEPELDQDRISPTQ